MIQFHRLNNFFKILSNLFQIRMMLIIYNHKYPTYGCSLKKKSNRKL